MHVALTASLAIDRAISAASIVATSKGHKTLHFVFASPSFDLPRILCAEKANVNLTAVGREGSTALPSLTSIESVLLAKAGKSHCVLFLSSPENPTGQQWPFDQLGAAAVLCAKYQATMIVDHSFLVAGVQDAGSVAPIWSTSAGRCDWIALWDTGKTFGLLGEKLAFIVSSNRTVSDAVETSLGVLQFELPALSMALFNRLLRSPLAAEEVGRLRRACRGNVAQLRLCLPPWVRLIEPVASTVALLDVSGCGLNDVEAQAKLLAAGVGTIAARAFFHGASTQRYLRVCLARDRAYFGRGAQIMAECLKNLAPHGAGESDPS